MKLTYDHVVDALYIELKDTIIIGTKIITPSLNLDFDEFDQVVGIEILNVCASGIDPMSLILKHYTSDSIIEVPSEEEIIKHSQEIEAARNRFEERQKAAQKSKETR